MNQPWVDTGYVLEDDQDGFGHQSSTFGIEDPLGQLVWPDESTIFSYGDCQLGMVDPGAQLPFYDFEDVNPANSTFPTEPSPTDANTPIILQQEDWNTPGGSATDNVYRNPDLSFLFPGFSPSGVAGEHVYQNCSDFSDELSGAGSSPSCNSNNSNSSQANALSCPVCPVQKNNAKDLHRHVVEAHEKPSLGEDKLGWYRCRCGNTACYYRKPNHVRHLSKCQSKKWSIGSFMCHCGKAHEDKEQHTQHFMRCRIGRRPVGRPKSN
ncbi:hypothetical protein PGQ11_005592 [Apiospora arundinis]|uniref:C2H2-type domain-containing protein n=1 Tax=Apiospora arundinis TaxID=335852 RepID=A0ABR2JC06_9PEZI